MVPILEDLLEGSLDYELLQYKYLSEVFNHCSYFVKRGNVIKLGLVYGKA